MLPVSPLRVIDLGVPSDVKGSVHYCLPPFASWAFLVLTFSQLFEMTLVY